MRTNSVSRSRALRSLGRFCLALAITTGTPGAVRADDDATLTMARERFKEGVHFFDLKQYDKARAAFLQAYVLKRHPAVLLNLAQSELRSGHEADAAKHFAQYLREHEGATEAEHEAAEVGLASARAHIAELVISADEEGATVILNGQTEGLTPLPSPLYLEPGTHMLTIRKDGREASGALNLEAGQRLTTNVRLRKSPKAPAKPSEEEEEREPEAETTETVLATSEAPGTSFDLETPPPPERARRQPFFRWAARSPVAWIGGGITALGLGSSVGLWVASQRKYSDANSIAEEIREEASNPPAHIIALLAPSGRTELDTKGICKVDLKDAYPEVAADQRGSAWLAQFGRACDAYSSSANDGDTLKAGAWVGVGVAAVAAAGTVVYYFASNPKEQPEDASARSIRLTGVAPWFGGGTQGLVLSGEF